MSFACLVFYLITNLLLVLGNDQAIDPNIRRNSIIMYSEGAYAKLADYLNEIERTYGTLDLDEIMPSLYSYLGIAYHNMQKPDETIAAFRKAVQKYPNDTQGWINLGEQHVQMIQIPEAIKAFESGYKLGDNSALSRLLKAKSWSGWWEKFEVGIKRVERALLSCKITSDGTKDPNCKLNGTTTIELSMNIPGYYRKYLEADNPNSLSRALIPVEAKASLRGANDHGSLKIGFVSSDFGVHPVATLIRGVIQELKRRHSGHVDLYVLPVNGKMSWWGLNISGTSEHFIPLFNYRNTFEAAQAIASYGIEILIDLNGHTKDSALQVFAYRPAPLQISFLGLPVTTGAAFVDYYLGDFVALPPEQSDHFSERLILMNPCYISNDYAQLRGQTLDATGAHRMPRAQLYADLPLDYVGSINITPPMPALSAGAFEEMQNFLIKSPYIRPPGVKDIARFIGTLSSYQKIDPSIFHVWMNVLHRFPSSIFAFVHFEGSDASMINFRISAKYYGIKHTRLARIPQAPWFEHIPTKTAFDLFLDTHVKTGHTTALDAVFAGVPSVTMGGGATMSGRATESIVAAFESDYNLLSYSLKEYEDMAIDLLRNPGKLDLIRKHTERLRSTSRLFDTEAWTAEFVSLMESTWNVFHADFPDRSAYGYELVNRDTSRANNNHIRHPNYHVFSILQKSNSLASTHPLAHEYPVHYRNNVTIPLQKPVQFRQVDEMGVDVGSDFRKVGDVELIRNHRIPRVRKFIADELSISKGSASVDYLAHRQRQSAKAKEYEGNRTKKVYEPIPPEVFHSEYIMLNIGGIVQRTGWYSVNAQRVSYGGKYDKQQTVEIIREMDDLYGFPNRSVAAVYSSHTLEHAAIGDGQLTRTLNEWHRVLRPGGMLAVSVPDFEMLCRLYLDPRLTDSQKWDVTLMMYGGQVDNYDYHLAGYSYDVLEAILKSHGFCDIERVGNFNIHEDASSLRKYGVPISLNIVAKPCLTTEDVRCLSGKTNVGCDKFVSINHAADKYIEEYVL